MLLVNNPGSDPSYTQLDHAPWSGWTFTDTIFPFFLWIVGVAMTLSFAKRMEQSADRTHLLLHVVRRAAIIYLLGLFFRNPLLSFGTYSSCGCVATDCHLLFDRVDRIFVAGWRTQIGVIFLAFTVYWLLMTLYPVPGLGAGHWEKGSNFAAYIDQMFLHGHMWGQTKTWDPEGIVSTLPAIGTTLLGRAGGPDAALAGPWLEVAGDFWRRIYSWANC